MSHRAATQPPIPPGGWRAAVLAAYNARPGLDGALNQAILLDAAQNQAPPPLGSATPSRPALTLTSGELLASFPAE